MEIYNTNHSAATVRMRSRVAPMSTVQGSGLPFTGSIAAAAATDLTLGAVRKAGYRVPSRGRPL
ncbi:MAG: hypothetical protein JWM40_1674 [Frankiales bacterium]|nr:hypothetical protein [Frankiales bacterium]